MEINEVKVNSFAPICKVLNRFFFQCKKRKARANSSKLGVWLFFEDLLSFY